MDCTLAAWGAFILALGLAVPASGAPPHNYGDILPLGDSITSISYGGAGSVHGAYRDQLYTRLTADGSTFRFVGSQLETNDAKLIDAGQAHHEGHGGYRIIDLDHNLTALDDDTTGYPSSSNSGGHWLDGISDGPDARPALHPNIILLLAGTNDITTGAGVSNQSDNLLTRMRSLLNGLFAARPKAQVFIGTLTQRDDNLEPTVEAFNALLPGLIAEPQYAGKHLHLVDLWTAVGSNLGDSVHPNAVGMEAMGDAWYAAITKYADPVPVPEPASLGLLAVGALGLLRRRHADVAARQADGGVGSASAPLTRPGG